MRFVEDPLNWKTIQAFTQLFVECLLPEQDMLFGSYALGDGN